MAMGPMMRLEGKVVSGSESRRIQESSCVKLCALYGEERLLQPERHCSRFSLAEIGVQSA